MKLNNDADWKDLFPYQEVRPEQDLAIRTAIEQLEHKKFFILEAGTGVGKSAVGLTLAKYFQSAGDLGSYFLTTQKILQDQYVSDFSNLGVRSIKSSTNFQCKHHRKNTCAQSMRILKTAKKGSAFWNTCMFKCPYRNSKQQFLDSKLSVTNFPYFLAESNYAKKITPRDFLVVDEAHNAPGELSKFIEIVISEKFSRDFLNIKMPGIKTHKAAIEWIKEIYHPKLFRKFKHMEKKIEDFNLSSRLDEFTVLARQYEVIDKHLCKLNRFLEVHDYNNWIFNINSLGSFSKLEFKPIDIAPFADQMLFRFGKKVLLMSATILNKDGYCEMVGIKKEDAAFLHIDSPFDKKNRPILFFPVGRMVQKEIDRSLPILAEAVSKIIENHKEEKGIIHCHTFKIAKYLMQNIKSKRLLTHNSDNREEVLNRHKKSKKPTVLLSPSMTEGVDLAGDISRFQILCKIPYPYLGDKLVSKKMNKWRWWYPLQTAKTVVQSVGRSVRNEKDHAVTYILDSDWESFHIRNRQLFPSDFNSCIM